MSIQQVATSFKVLLLNKSSMMLNRISFALVNSQPPLSLFNNFFLLLMMHTFQFDLNKAIV